MIESGFGSQILLGTDGARRSLWSTQGGTPGLAALYHSAIAAVDRSTSDALFVANPARFLTLGR
jgi:phosphotriesterase-related protein